MTASMHLFELNASVPAKIKTCRACDEERDASHIS